MFLRAVLSALRLGCLGIALASCTQPTPRPYSDAELAMLASDAHVVVADTHLVLPLVALSGFARKHAYSLNRERDRKVAKERFDAFREAAADPRTAPVQEKLEISVRPYGSDDFGRRLGHICAHFDRQWSRSICRDAWAPLVQALPERFHLADDRQFSAFDSHYTVGRQRQSDQLKAMKLKSGEASISCDPAESASGTRYCMAALLVDGHLAAVWTVWNNAKESPAARAERQGKAIEAFVRHAIGPAEDFPALFSAACTLRDPASRIGPRGDHCAGPPVPEEP